MKNRYLLISNKGLIKYLSLFFITIVILFIVYLIPNYKFLTLIILTLIFLNISMLLKLISNNFETTMIWKGIESWLEEFEKENNLNSFSNKEIFNKEDLNINIRKKYLDLLLKINKIAKSLKKSAINTKRNENVNLQLIDNLTKKLNYPLEDILMNIEKLKSVNNDNEIIELLKNKSNNLKKLIEELFEASKTATGDMTLEINEIEIVEFLKQAIIEFEDKINESTISFRPSFPKEDIVIYCSGEKLWRVFDILFENALKHSLENSRVYIDVRCSDNKVYICIKNTSKKELNIEPKDLIYIINNNKEENVSGLGLEIAKNLVILQKGSFNISIDGDLFKVEISFNINSVQEACLEEE